MNAKKSKFSVEPFMYDFDKQTSSLSVQPVSYQQDIQFILTIRPA